MCKIYPSTSDSSFFFVKSTMPSVLHCEHFSGFPPGRPNLTCLSEPQVQIFVVRFIIFSDLHSMHAVRGPPFTPNRFTLFEPHEHLPPQASSGFFESDLRGASTRSERPQNRKRNHPRPSFPETTRIDGVKASLHNGTPRSTGSPCPRSCSRCSSSSLTVLSDSPGPLAVDSRTS